MGMAAFSHPHHIPFALDVADTPVFSLCDLLPPSAQQQAGDLASASSYFCYYHSDAVNIAPAEIPVVNAGWSSATINKTTSPNPEGSSSLESRRTAPSDANKITCSSSSAQRSEVASNPQCSPERKRKDRQSSNCGSAQPKNAKDVKSGKLKRCSGAVKEAEEKAARQEPPTGYVHVRARPGQATDSHSLAERVRRERIRERMKMLQALVPGCDKVVGKALLLDEIINYVQSLQSQVEFLSMKLATVSSVSYDFGLVLEDCMIQPERLENMSLGLPNVQRTGHIQPTAFADTTNSYPVQDTSVPFLLHGEGSSAFPQDNGSNFVMHVDDQGQTFLNQVDFVDMSSFQ